MPPKTTKRWVPVNRNAGASHEREGGDPDTDRHSALPVAPLHQRLVGPATNTTRYQRWVPATSTMRWVPVSSAGGASGSRGRKGGDPDADRRSVLPVTPLHQGLVPVTSTTRHQHWVPATSTMRWVPVNRAGGASSSRGCEGGDPDADRLSALPDALLHHIMSSLKAWEVVRTCVLSQRWRHLWQSVPCIDLRVAQDDYDGVPEDFPDFLCHLFHHRDAMAALDTLCLRLCKVDGVHSEDDARLWIGTAIKCGARVVHLVGHHKMDWFCGGCLEHSSFVSCHLKVLKLSYALLDDNILRQLSCHCPSLEELDLKRCMITGHEILSASLKILTMFKCQIDANLSIAALNLVLLRCISPISQAPSFQNMGSIVAGTILLEDYAFNECFELLNRYKLSETTDEDGVNQKYKSGYGFGALLDGYGLGDKDDYDYGSDIDSDDDTYEYSEIANDCDDYGFSGDVCNSSTDGNCHVHGENSGCNENKIEEGYNSLQIFSNATSLELFSGTGEDKIKGGYNILQIFSNATSLELLGDAVEVILTRELKRCPSFINLKTLSLGEWCIDADFDALVFLLQHAPNLEKLFLELKLDVNARKPLVSGVKPRGRSFTCKYLRKVKIKCSKDDLRVHKLAHLFRANGIPDENIFVRRTGSTYLRGELETRDIARSGILGGLLSAYLLSTLDSC